MARASTVGRIAGFVILAAAGAAVANLAASTGRKLAWVATYPRALEVGPPEAEPISPVVTAPVSAATPEPPAATPAASAPAPAAATAAVTAPTPAAEVPAPPPPAALPAADLVKSFPPHPDKPAVEIGPADVEHLYRAKALFLDARRSSVYGEGHIAGARSFPVWESDIGERVKALYEEGLDQKQPIVVYCSGGNCEDSHMLAEKLYMVGFDNVLVYKDGYPDWQKRRLPVSKGTNR